MLSIDDAIRTRKTVKMQVEPETPRPADTDLRATLEELISLAGWAPFHKACDRSHRGSSRVVEPWRFYVLEAQGCRNLIQLHAILANDLLNYRSQCWRHVEQVNWRQSPRSVCSSIGICHQITIYCGMNYLHIQYVVVVSISQGRDFFSITVKRLQNFPRKILEYVPETGR